ncbi:Oidioi.mRNA.OKI2018_I69.chr2.g4770.t1.cds [Oikopleura dioica]|uniref:Hexosyltransferase n=1 Tax=Oikopleura dioica TaxID=34765 RepID=A0ABN7T1Q6_OIKDI|nr:Oidioi.mRNA.OKI2018_I69.chr2.g4770.t1.cds [Oikopleura dioica]
MKVQIYLSERKKNLIKLVVRILIPILTGSFFSLLVPVETRCSDSPYSIGAKRVKLFKPVKNIAARLDIDYEDFEPVRITNELVLHEALGDPEENKKFIKRPARLSEELGIKRHLLSITVLSPDEYRQRARFITETLGDNFDDMVFVIYTQNHHLSMIDGINTILLPDVGTRSQNEQILMELVSTDFADQFNFIFISNGAKLGTYQMKSFLEDKMSYREELFGSNLDSGILYTTKILRERKEELVSKCQTGLNSGWKVESWLVSCLKKINDPAILLTPLLPQTLLGSFENIASAQKASIASEIESLREKLTEIEVSMHSMTAPEVTQQAEEMNQILYRDLLPATRWDVLEWKYFEEDELFSCQSQEVKCPFPNWLESELADAKNFIHSISAHSCLSSDSITISGYYATLNDHTRYLLDFDGPECEASMRFDLIRKTIGFELVNALEFSQAPMPLIVLLFVSSHNVDYLPKFLNTLQSFQTDDIELLPIFISNPKTSYRAAKDRLAKSGLALVNKNAESADFTWHFTSSGNGLRLLPSQEQKYLKTLLDGINEDAAFITLEPSDLISEDLLESCRKNAAKENLSTVNIGFQLFGRKFREGKDQEIAKNEGIFHAINEKTLCSRISHLTTSSKKLRILDPSLRFRSIVFNCNESSLSNKCIKIQSKALGKRSSLGKWYTENSL